jgi:hypothetical protein
MHLAINSVGLSVSILGTVLVFFFGIPPKIDRQGHSYLLLEQDDESEKAKARRYDSWSRTGLVLLILGFALQLVSNFL